MPILLIGHVASTRLAYELFGLSSDYTRVVANLWASATQGWQLGLMAPGWLHGCLGLHFAFNRRRWYRQFRLRAVCHRPAAAGAVGARASSPWARSLPRTRRRPPRRWNSLSSGQRRAAARDRAVEGQSAQLVLLHHRCGVHRARNPQPARASPQASRLAVLSRPDRAACRAAGRCWRRAAASICRTPRCAAGGRDARPAGCG